MTRHRIISGNPHTGWGLLRPLTTIGLLIAAGTIYAQKPDGIFADPVINEFVFNHTGTDTNEFVEIFGDPSTDYSAFTVLEIEGDSGGSLGVIDGVFTLGVTNANGYLTTGFLNNQIENGTVTLLLVDGFVGSPGDDLDTNDDGTIDVTPWTRIVDEIAVTDGGGSDLTYSSVVLASGFDGVGFTPGGASRLPDGTDTDTVGDWSRNDFDGEGLPGFMGMVDPGEALNTPDAENMGAAPLLSDPVINEFVFNHTGTDTHEFVEIFGDASSDYSAFTILEIEGDSGGSLGVIDGVFVMGSTNASGYLTTGFLNNQIENGSVTLLLVEGFSGSPGDDLDTNDDGTIDVMPWSRIVDDVAVSDGGGSDLTYATVVLASGFDGIGFTPGGASRLPNGTDTDTVGDWTRNDFDGEGLPGFSGSLDPGEALNTPDAENMAVMVQADPVINEFVFNHTGSDTHEFVEIKGDGSSDYSAYTVLELEGDSGGSLGVIDGAFAMGITNAGGYLTTGFLSNQIENGSVTLLLVEGFSGTPGDDLDTNDDGTIDVMPWTRVVDDVAVSDGGGSDLTYSSVVLASGFDGVGFTPGGASRLPDGGDTDTVGDWTRNDFDGEGLPGFSGTPDPGEALNTPAAANSSTATFNIVINEVDADTPGTDDMEFVELFGSPNTALDGLVLVFYNGNGDTSYNAFDLDGFSLDADGFFVAGNAAVANVSIVFGSNGLQNGADAVALYLGDAGDFPNGTAVTASNIIDALVYDTGDADDSELLTTLTPGQAQIDEGGGGNQSGHSNSRVPDGGTRLDTTTYVQQAPTPGVTNVPPPMVVINEVDADTPGTDVMEFVELIGAPGTALDGLVVVFFNGSSDTSYAAFDLDGFSLSATGFFVLGNAGVANVDIVFGSNGLQNGADAVAIYAADATDFPNGTAVSSSSLVDAVVYDTNDSDDAGLLAALTPGMPQVNEGGGSGSSTDSNSRVPDGGTPFDTTVYTQQAPTPGAHNVISTIAEIQGNGLASPLDGSSVATAGNIVTGVGPEGFTMQSSGGARDADPDTSEGIYVFTDAPPAVSTGDEVDVIATVTEFFDLTELIDPVVTVVSSGNALPTPVLFDAMLPSPNQPQDPLEYERFEGMLVEIQNGYVASGNQRFGSDDIAEIYIVANTERPFREPGILFPGMPMLPVWDGNPEVFELDPDRLGLPNETVAGGASFSATGVIGFDFGQYEIWPTSFNHTDPVLPRPVRARNPGEFTVGSQNVRRLFTTDTNYNDRLAKFSLLVRQVLGSPDILSLQEMGGLTVFQDLAARILADDPTVSYTAHMLPGNDIGGIEVGFLVRDNVTVNGVSQIQPAEMFDFMGNMFTLHDRPPLLLNATIGGAPLGAGFDISVIVVHNRSLIDIDSSDFVRTKRHLQAQRLSQEIQTLQTNDPNINLMVLGDFNGFEFSDGYVDVLGQITGNPDPLGALVPATDEVNPDLTNHSFAIAADDRYSFIQNGSSQMIDHVLTSSNMACLVQGLEYGRANTDAPRITEDDPSTPLRSTDHDGMVAYIEMPAINVAPTAGLMTSETGTSDSFAVSLTTMPSSDVTIPIMSGDLTEGTVSTTSLVFTPGNWATPQTVTVTGVDDNVVDGNVVYLVTVGTASGDACYAGIDPPDVSVTNVSKDAAGITVSPTAGLVTDEDGGSDLFTVVLDSEPVADVTIPLSISDPDEAMLSDSSLTFNAGNWNVPQPVTVTGVADIIIDLDMPFTVVTGAATSGDPNYGGTDPADVTGTNVNVNFSDDFDIFATPGQLIAISGTPNAFLGLYRRDPVSGDWIYIENVQLIGPDGTSTTIALPDSTYGVGGPDGSLDPTNRGVMTVPLLGPFGMAVLVMALVVAALVVNRRRRRAA